MSSSAYTTSSGSSEEEMEEILYKRLVARKQKTAKKCNNPPVARKRTKRKRPPPTSHDTTLLFQDDGTGKKLLHPAALRFSLKLAERESQRTIASVSKSLLDNGEMEESRRVQVQSSQHVESILSHVRDTLRKTKIPIRYVRIDDVTLGEALSTINETRRKEVEMNTRLQKKLEGQRHAFQEEYTIAKNHRDALWTNNHNNIRHHHKNAFHDLLLTHHRNHNKPIVSHQKQTTTTRTTTIKAPKQTLRQMLQQLPSPYDEDEFA